jgi:hypothetical protein
MTKAWYVSVLAHSSSAAAHLVQIANGIDKEGCFEREERNEGRDGIQRDPEESVYAQEDYRPMQTHSETKRRLT